MPTSYLLRLAKENSVLGQQSPDVDKQNKSKLNVLLVCLATLLDLCVNQAIVFSYALGLRSFRVCLFGGEIGWMKNFEEKMRMKTFLSVLGWMGMKENKW